MCMYMHISKMIISGPIFGFSQITIWSKCFVCLFFFASMCSENEMFRMHVTKNDVLK